MYFISSLVPSGPPRNLATTDVTSRSISLTWDPPIAANQNGIIRAYFINMTVLESGENIQFMSNSTDRDFVMLHPYYTYTFIISAVTIGPGPPSAVHNVLTAEEGNLNLCLTTSSNINRGTVEPPIKDPLTTSLQRTNAVLQIEVTIVLIHK